MTHDTVPYGTVTSRGRERDDRLLTWENAGMVPSFKAVAVSVRETARAAAAAKKALCIIVTVFLVARFCSANLTLIL